MVRWLWALVVVLVFAMGVLGWKVHDLDGRPTLTANSVAASSDGLADRLADLETRVDNLDRDTTRTPGEVPALERDVAALRAEIAGLPTPTTARYSPPTTDPRVASLQQELDRVERCVGEMRSGEDRQYNTDCIF